MKWEGDRKCDRSEQYPVKMDKARVIERFKKVQDDILDSSISTQAQHDGTDEVGG
jgi:hypothetical protein